MAIVIDLKATGTRSVINSISRLRKELEDLKASWADFSKTFGAVGVASSNAVASINNVASSSRRALGPLANLIQKEKELQAAIASGDPIAIFDAKHAVFKARKQYQTAANNLNANPMSDFFKHLRSLIFSTRIGAGGAQPLIGKILQLGLSFGRLNPVILALTAALSGMIAAIAASLSFLKDFTAGHWKGGGTPGQTAAGMRIGAAAGRDFFADSRALAGALAEGGYAAAQLRQAGIMDRPGPYGKINQTENMLKTLDYLRRLGRSGKAGRNQAMRIARDAGVGEEYLNLAIDSSDKDYETLTRKEDKVSKADRQVFANFQIQWNAFLQNIKDLSMAIGVPVLRAVTIWLRALNKALEFTSQHIGIISPVFFLIGKFLEWIDNIINGGRGANKADDKMKDLTDSLDMNTKAVNKLREIFGGGDTSRAQGAVPAGWRGMMFDKMGNQGINLGAFSL